METKDDRVLVDVEEHDDHFDDDWTMKMVFRDDIDEMKPDRAF